MRRTRSLVLPVLACVVLTACSGTDDEADSGPAASSGGSSEAAEAVRTAAGGTGEDGSSKIVLSSTTAVGGQDVTFAGQGAFDYAADNAQLTFQVPGANGEPNGGGAIEQRIIGPDLFLTLPQQPGTFFRLKVADVAGTSLGGSTDPTAPLDALQSVTQAEQVGQEQVRGVSTTHYRGTYDPKAAVEQAEGAARTLLESTLGVTTLDQVPFDAYVDEQDRIVKFEQQLELPGTEQTGGQPLTSRTVLELYDFGSVVTVEAPPASQVRDGAPLLAALQAAVPQSSAAPSASPSS